MKQIKEQMELILIGGYAYIELPLAYFRRKLVRFVNITVDWVMDQYQAIKQSINELKNRLEKVTYTTFRNATPTQILNSPINSYARHDNKKLMKLRNIPVSKRTRRDRKNICECHARRSLRKSLKRKIKKLESKHRWVFQ